MRAIAVTLCLAACGSSGPSWQETQSYRRQHVERCTAGGFQDCSSAGDWLVDELRLDEARIAYRRGCEGGDILSCAHGIETFNDPDLVAKACEVSPHHCFRLAESLPATDPRFAATVDRACDADAQRCVRLLDQLHRRGVDVQRNAQRFCERFSTSCSLLPCSLGNPEACDSKQRERMRLACRANDSEACRTLGRAIAAE